MATQNYKNHTRFDPSFHFFLIPLELVILVFAVVHVYRFRTPADSLLVVVSVALLLSTLTARMYAIKVQDRVIRLEENMRLHALGIDPSGLSMKQMIAIRFAPDEEAPSLVPRATAEGMTPKQIKAAIAAWRADHHRV